MRSSAFKFEYVSSDQIIICHVQIRIPFFHIYLEPNYSTSGFCALSILLVDHHWIPMLPDRVDLWDDVDIDRPEDARVMASGCI
ncbi:hypothetical protein BLOT_015854 [Blomia tropicalis]|nr:hypothetical protein BLOT_015854 [Blomia tropicalis]